MRPKNEVAVSVGQLTVLGDQLRLLSLMLKVGDVSSDIMSKVSGSEEGQKLLQEMSHRKKKELTELKVLSLSMLLGYITSAINLIQEYESEVNLARDVAHVKEGAIRRANEEIDQLRKELEQLDGEFAKLDEKYSCKKQALKSVGEELKLVVEENEKLRKKISELEEVVGNSRANLQINEFKYGNRIAELTREVESLQIVISNLQNVIATLEKDKNEKDKNAAVLNNRWKNMAAQQNDVVSQKQQGPAFFTQPMSPQELNSTTTQPQPASLKQPMPLQQLNSTTTQPQPALLCVGGTPIVMVPNFMVPNFLQPRQFTR